MGRGPSKRPTVRSEAVAAEICYVWESDVKKDALAAVQAALGR